MTYLIHSQIRIKIDTPPRIKKIVQDISILFFTTFVISFELVRYPCTWIYKIEIEETVYGEDFLKKRCIGEDKLKTYCGRRCFRSEMANRILSGL